MVGACSAPFAPSQVILIVVVLFFEQGSEDIEH
jgi:hypothetical protein